MCMGQQMAMSEVKGGSIVCSIAEGASHAIALRPAVLAYVVPRMRFVLVPGQKIVRFPNITIAAKNGILMRVEKTAK